MIDPNDDLVVALDAPAAKTGKADKDLSLERAFFLIDGASVNDGASPKAKRVTPGNVLTALKRRGTKKIQVVLYPTRTYSEGFGGHLFSDLAPEDRRMIRVLTRHFDSVPCSQVLLRDTTLFEDLPRYFKDDAEKQRYCSERNSHAERAKAATAPKTTLVEFDPKFLTNIKEIFRSCLTKPNKQDFFYLATKTFGINLVVRTAFAAKGVMRGDLPLHRAIIANSWYQLQDVVFTVFGQTYMKFLGRMAGMLRVYKAYIGDFAFVYFQFCFLEFLNRLLLGPIGENPLAYTWKGISLIFLNNLQGLISGGPLVPAINKIRRSGAISHSMMMHLYQVSSLCLYFGLFASYGYQKIYFALTTSVLLFAWGSYVIFSVFYKDPPFRRIDNSSTVARLDKLVTSCYSSNG